MYKESTALSRTNDTNTRINSKRVSVKLQSSKDLCRCEFYINMYVNIDILVYLSYSGYQARYTALESAMLVAKLNREYELCVETLGDVIIWCPCIVRLVSAT